MPISPPASQVVGLDPGAGAGEGVARCPGRRVIAATRGHPCLCVLTSSVGKVGEGAETGSIGVEKLHRSVDIGTTRYQDH